MRIARLVAVLVLTSVLSLGCAGMSGAQGEKRPAPGFTTALISGGEVSLSEFKGTPVVLNIGASWCPHCLHEMPAMNEEAEEYWGRVQFLMVFVKSDRKDVEALIKKHHLRFKVGFDPDAIVGKAYGVKGIPVTFFIDREGFIVDDYFGSIEKDELAEKIDSLLGVKKK